MLLDPLFYMNEDLIKYTKETGDYKLNVLLVNKADFLTEAQRIHWARYFRAHNIEYIFWSALREIKTRTDSQPPEQNPERPAVPGPSSSEEEKLRYSARVFTAHELLHVFNVARKIVNNKCSLRRKTCFSYSNAWKDKTLANYNFGSQNHVMRLPWARFSVFLEFQSGHGL
ncbi:hypothetical protein Pelo_19262 [Pelomyxa schiedti]|nr:hypothetical protein Pelo_19262 [Pelomyxa schiedti]